METIGDISVVIGARGISCKAVSLPGQNVPSPNVHWNLVQWCAQFHVSASDDARSCLQTIPAI